VPTFHVGASPLLLYDHVALWAVLSAFGYPFLSLGIVLIVINLPLLPLLARETSVEFFLAGWAKLLGAHHTHDPRH